MISQTKELQIKKKCISIQPRGLAYWERRSSILAQRVGNGARLPEKKPAGVRCDSLLCRIIPA